MKFSGSEIVQFALKKPKIAIESEYQYHIETVMNITAFVELLHKGQRRRTGEKYTTHLYAVRDHLVHAGVKDKELLCAALLHDSLEDSYITKEFLEFRFGKRVADIVDVLTKEEGWITRFVKAKSSADFIGISLDDYPEAVVVKLADLIHNIETIQGFSPPKRKKYLSETREFLFPLFYNSLNDERLKEYHHALQYLLKKLEDSIRKQTSELSIDVS